jgi:hypothetical protein
MILPTPGILLVACKRRERERLGKQKNSEKRGKVIMKDLEYRKQGYADV